MFSSFLRSSSCHCFRYAWISTFPFPTWQKEKKKKSEQTRIKSFSRWAKVASSMSFLLNRVVGPRTKQGQSLHYPLAPQDYTYKSGYNISTTLGMTLLSILYHHTLSQLYSLKRHTVTKCLSRILYLFLGCSSKNHFQDYPQQMKLQFRRRKRRKSYLRKKDQWFISFYQKFFP